MFVPRGTTTVTANGKGFAATLATNQRGNGITCKAKMRDEAFAEAHQLLDQAARREWLMGEAVSVRVEQVE
jgi:hypothetical protein